MSASVQAPPSATSRTPQPTSPRLILAAYQCGPGMGSVSQIGWEWYSRLAHRSRVTLVTHVRNRAALSAAGAPLADSEVIYVDTEWFAAPLYWIAKKLFPKSQHAVFLLTSLDFYVYDSKALSLLRKRRLEGERWDAVHAVTPVSPVASTRLHGLGLPLILGPWNGGLPSPKQFKEILREDSVWLYPVRNLGRVADFFLGATRRASIILTATRATLETIPKRRQHLCVSMLENGVDLDRFQPAPWPPAPGKQIPLRVLYVGRLVPFKAVGLLLKAAALVKSEFPIQLTIVGEGPMESEWKEASRKLGLAEDVSFPGAASLDQVAEYMRFSHVFCLPSVRESGGAVLMEALASARPVIAVAYGGPAELVIGDVGVAIEPAGADWVIIRIAAALRDIVSRPEVWRCRGEQGRRHAEAEFSWTAKVEQALALYKQVVH